MSLSGVDGADCQVNDLVFDSDGVERRSWIFCGEHLPRSEIVFFAQTILVFILVIVSVACLALAKTCEETTVWVAVLSSSVGYMLPSPRL